MTDREKLTVAVSALESALRGIRTALRVAQASRSSYLAILLRSMSRRIEQILEEVR